ncbi:hypothetical protein TNCV_871851 [Trichonephila clavipes]|nr:hypothetical protein TNCV_871851 [Trichonephila clavipes]
MRHNYISVVTYPTQSTITSGRDLRNSSWQEANCTPLSLAVMQAGSRSSYTPRVGVEVHHDLRPDDTVRNRVRLDLS